MTIRISDVGEALEKSREFWKSSKRKRRGVGEQMIWLQALASLAPKANMDEQKIISKELGRTVSELHAD